MSRDWVLTRVMSVVAHGLDVALSLGRPPWTTPAALHAVHPVLVSLLGAPPPVPLAWDELALLQTGAGRRPRADGVAHLVPLSFLWDGARLVVATPEASPTGRNLRESGRVRVGLGPTRDVVLIDGAVESFSRQTVPAEVAEEFAAKRWDARREPTPYGYFRITPQRIQAWREENELAGRTLMREGRWLV